MRYLKKMFENRENGIHRICREWGIENYTINSDGSIDVDNTVLLWDKNLENLPLQFRRVGENFNCNNNKLTTLEGAPEYIGLEFWCNNNRLTTLEYAPKYIRGSFFCWNNRLTDLEHFPEYVGGGVYIHDNPIYSIVKHFIDRKEDRQKIIKLFNSTRVVQGNKVILDYLEYVFETHGIELDDYGYWDIRKYYTII